jgi:hypothetical protein
LRLPAVQGVAPAPPGPAASRSRELGRLLPEEYPDLAHVGRHEEHGRGNALGSHSVEPAAPWFIEGLVVGVLDVAVESFVGVAQGGVGGAPLIAGRAGQFLTVMLTPELNALPVELKASDTKEYEPLGTVVVFQLHTHP